MTARVDGMGQQGAMRYGLFSSHFSLIFHHSHLFLTPSTHFPTVFHVFSCVFNSPHAYSMNNAHPRSNPPIYGLKYAKLTVFGTTHVSSPPVHILLPFSTVNTHCRPPSATSKCSKPYDTCFAHFSPMFPPFSLVTCFYHLFIFQMFSTCFRVFSRVFNSPHVYSMNNAHPCSNPPISGPSYMKIDEISCF